jgi:hypothetical protein
MFDVGVERIKEQRQQQQAQLQHEQASTSTQDLENQVRKLTVKRMTRQNDILEQLQGIDTSKPDAADRRRDLLFEYNALSGKPMVEKERWATNPLQIKAAAAVGWSGPLNEMPAEVAEKYEKKVIEFALAEKTISSSTTDQYGNTSSTSRTEHTRLGGGSGVPPAPTHLGGAPSGGGKKSSIGEEEYRIAKAGGKLVPKAMEAANRYAVDNGLSIPVPITPADRKSLAGLTNLEAALPDLEKYSTVLGSTKSRLKLQEIVNQVTKTGANSGMISSVEGFIGAGVNAVLVNSLTPEEQNFLMAYNQGREAVQTMRQFAGVSRSTQALYNAMAALLPNPGQTKNQAMARDQIARLRKQIATARATVGGVPEEAAPGNQPNTKKADAHGFVAD